MPFMADASVRRAVTGDATGIARVQGAVWAHLYADVLPAEVLVEVAGQGGADTWAAAIATPPAERNRLLVALDDVRLVGVSALSPATDPDLVPRLDAELHVFCVDPDEEGRGHGSRLLNASADVMRELGFSHLHVWLGEPERGLWTFLEGAGWAPDGAVRTLDLRGDSAVVVEQVRLRTSLEDA
jgi:GNAT superfamily N-acetyltransferase